MGGPLPGTAKQADDDLSSDARTSREILAARRPQPRTAQELEPPRRPVREATFAESATRLFWMVLLATAAMCVWRIGPRILEDYQYAVTAGKVRAEYQVAVEMLKERPLTNVSLAYQLVAQRIRPSVVSVWTERPDKGTGGQGSGVVMSKDGYILTNAHVVSNAKRIRIALFDRHEYDAKLVGIDLNSDLAVIQINAPNLIPAQWGNSEETEVGSIVWAIGSPYGLDQTVTSGIISGKNRRDVEHQNRELLQTDAAVNPGNSGGPLVDANGDVIGINTSIFGETFQGISFAVPSTIARFVFQQLIDYGKVTRGYLGVEPGTVIQEVADELKLPNLDGAYVSRVAPNSPADLGGLQMHDVILSWNDQPITVHSMLFQLVEMTPPHERAKVMVARDGELCELEITVGDREQAIGSR
jgi:serine protease Do